MIGGTGAEVEVDTETGHVTVTRLINVADLGRPINPKIVETQLSGAALMQLGFTMFEKMHFDGGQVTNASPCRLQDSGDIRRAFEHGE